MRVILGDLLTGRRILDVPFMEASWSVELNGPGSVSASVDLHDPEVRALELHHSATIGKSFLAVVVDDKILEAGPVWSRKYSRASGTLSLEAAGLWSYFDMRTLLPYIGDLPVIDPATGESAAYANSTWSGMHLGTIGKRIVQQSMTWQGGNLPIVFEADKPGTAERTYKGAELPKIGQMLQNLTEVEDGPDIAFRPEWTPDRLGVQWRYVSGDPRLTSQRAHIINASVPGSPLADLDVTETGGQMGSLGWCSAGRSADVSIIERAWNHDMVAAGFPLMERIDSSRSTVSEVQTAKQYAAELARTGARPRASWPVTIHTGGDGEPTYTEYTEGDFIDFKMLGDPLIPDGVHTRRIVNMSGEAGSPDLKIGLGESFG